VIYLYEYPCLSSNPFRFDFVHSFIVYSTIDEHVLTGGSMTEHLVRFPVSSEPSQHLANVANPPSYVAVSSNEVSSIYIQLNDYYGNILPFSARHRNIVSAKLHFRKRK
jgi:hypothetical protein